MTIPNTTPAPSAAIQPQTHDEFYSTAYLAEYYDVWIGSWTDTELYSSVLNETVSRTPATDPIIVLDIGAGTGRITHALAANLPKPTKTSNVHFLGVDNAPHMLERARTLTDPSHAAQISWILGSACDLTSLPSFRDEGLRVDMAVFACGSICHMYKPGQAEQVFRQVASVLRPETGRAYISVLKMGLAETGLAGQMETAQPEGLVRSKAFGDIVYREEWVRQEIVDCVWHNTRHITVVREMGDGTETVVEDNYAVCRLRIFGEDELRRAATTAGLRVVEVLDRRNDAHDELVFVFEVDS
ncbi:S-adenosyl-L-methionine-dependent methyltransferase [Aspergillus ellipticus CBS 707.79]|uniref:S-adenosyl-L-methionine-dependent methyltransferase n=1 Tax=Aspergillus ellipticus CBS 707.79 TaxID=1448320 RepID=A0A319DHV5_9EURO|nr:S-adenosyl-L-methionine-dependent methyltransferase [Aspergillus ellipticus CBS 707.79]